MNTPNEHLKYRLHLLIDDTHDEVKLLAALKLLDENYFLVEEPSSDYALKKRVEEAEKRMDAGQYTRHEDAKKMAEDW